MFEDTGKALRTASYILLVLILLGSMVMGLEMIRAGSVEGWIWILGGVGAACFQSLLLSALADLVDNSKQKSSQTFDKNDN